jgi:hypothetical protein
LREFPSRTLCDPDEEVKESIAPGKSASGPSKSTVDGVRFHDTQEMARKLSIFPFLVRRIGEVQKRDTQEAVMARQRTLTRNFKFIAGTALAGIGLYLLSGALDGPSALLTSLLSVAVREALGQLPYLLPTALQAAQGYSLDHLQSSRCPLQMLVLCWPLLGVLVGAA